MVVVGGHKGRKVCSPRGKRNVELRQQTASAMRMVAGGSGGLCKAAMRRAESKSRDVFCNSEDCKGRSKLAGIPKAQLSNVLQDKTAEESSPF